MKRILVIEDNEQNCYLTRFILEKNGDDVIEARDGNAGVDLAIREQPDRVIMDIQLPDIDGLEATKQIRNLELGFRIEDKSKIRDPKSQIKKVPIVALTSYAMTGDREKCLAAGCTGYIEKPINPDTFMAEINKFF